MKNENSGQKVETPQETEAKIMCYVSKEMVPMSATVEVQYSRGKKLRVQPKYLKFDKKEAE